MAETSTKRRREPYSRLICLGCRQRRIRCTLPDTTITPSAEPQPSEKKCSRCAQNGLDCVVDYTTLGRPAQKRNRPGQVSAQQPAYTSGGAVEAPFEDEVSHDVGDFLLSNPDGVDAGSPHPTLPPTRTEMIEACFSPFHLLPALLSRDGQFASSIGSQPLIQKSVIEIIDDETSELLDRHLVWHRLYYPDIPPLRLLRDEVSAMERGHTERPSCLFLLTLLYDLALDVPSVELAACRSLQPAVRALLFHTGQQVLFSLARTHRTVLSLVLVAQYRPLAFTSSQPAAAPALKAVPYALLAKQISTELGYSTAGARLLEALHTFETSTDRLIPLMHQCIHWIRLAIAHEMISNASAENIFKFRPAEATTAECADALGAATLLRRVPTDMLLPCVATCGLYRMLVALTEMAGQWRDLGLLGEGIAAHKAFVEREREGVETALEGDAGARRSGLASAISHLVAANMQTYHNTVKGCALFFAVMCGAYAQTSHITIQPPQAMNISNDIIHQLTSHHEDDPSRPSHRKFLETFGRTRLEELELELANFVTAGDTLVLDGIPYVGPTRQAVTDVLFVAKDIVEQQAARLKGWAALDPRIEIHLLLLQTAAQRLEAMSASAGTAAALAQGCVLSATAKLLRSLHGVLLGFKRKAQRGGVAVDAAAAEGVSTTTTTTVDSAGSSSHSKGTPPPQPPTQDPLPYPFLIDGPKDIDEDPFAHWENWPTFDPADFSDLFGGVFQFESGGDGISEGGFGGE